MERVSEDTSDEDREWTEDEVLTKSDLDPLLVAARPMAAAPNYYHHPQKLDIHYHTSPNCTAISLDHNIPQIH